MYTRGVDHFEQGASDACTGNVYNQQYRNIYFLVDTQNIPHHLNILQYTRDYFPEIFVICIHFFQLNKFILKMAKFKYSQLYWCITIESHVQPTSETNTYSVHFVYVEHNTMSYS